MKDEQSFRILDDDELQADTNINYGGILMRHVDRIGLLSSKGFSIINAVKILFNFLKPYHDTDFLDFEKELNRRYKIEQTNAYYNSLNHTSTKMTAPEEYYQEILGALMSLMDRKDLLLKSFIGWTDELNDKIEKGESIND